MGRNPCCPKEGMNRGAWTAVEDQELVDYIASHGEGKWRNIPKVAGLKRCGKSCRLRWLNYLRPGIKRGNISEDEEDFIIRLHKLLGNRWSLIAGRLPGRTDIEIKNYWNSNLSKKEQPKKQKLTNCSTELITKEDKENNATLKMASGKTSKTVSPEQPPSLLPPPPFQSLPPESVPNIELSGILESDFSMFGELDEAKGEEEGVMAEDWGELGCVQDIEFLMSSEFGSMASICNTQMNGIFDSF